MLLRNYFLPHDPRPFFDDCFLSWMGYFTVLRFEMVFSRVDLEILFEALLLREALCLLWELALLSLDFPIELSVGLANLAARHSRWFK